MNRTTPPVDAFDRMLSHPSAVPLFWWFGGVVSLSVPVIIVRAIAQYYGFTS